MAKISVSSDFVEATERAPQRSDYFTLENRKLIVEAKFGGRGVLHDPQSFRPKEMLRDIPDFVGRLWKVMASYKPAAGLGIGMMKSGTTVVLEGHGGFSNYVPLYFESSTEEEAIFTFEEKEGVENQVRKGWTGLLS